MPNIENVLNYLNNHNTLLFQYQELIGACLGIAGTITVGVLGFLLSRFLDYLREIRDSRRQAEISLALSINDVGNAISALDAFIDRLNVAVIEPLRKEIADKSTSRYVLNETNLPTLTIFDDTELMHKRYKSYYTHNKLLLVTKYLKNANLNLIEMREKYDSVVKRNALMLTSQISPSEQNDNYLQNNESFVEYAANIVSQLKQVRKELMKVKLYNSKFLNHEYLELWRLSGISFRFFSGKSRMKAYQASEDVFNKIDGQMSEEVEKEHQESELDK